VDYATKPHESEFRLGIVDGRPQSDDVTIDEYFEDHPERRKFHHDELEVIFGGRLDTGKYAKGYLCDE
jgi:hypothetical protein